MRSAALLAPLVLLLWVKGLPAEAQLLEKVVEAPQYKTLVDLLTAANLTSTLNAALQSGTQVTIFAPNNTAFSGLNATCLTSSANLPVLKTILLYHVAPTKVAAPTNGQIIATLANQTLTITINGSSIFANKELVTAPVVVDDPQGVVHGLASVLIPPTGGFAEAVTGCLLAAPKPGAAPAPPLNDWQGTCNRTCTCTCTLSSICPPCEKLRCPLPCRSNGHGHAFLGQPSLAMAPPSYAMHDLASKKLARYILLSVR